MATKKKQGEASAKSREAKPTRAQKSAVNHLMWPVIQNIYKQEARDAITGEVAVPLKPEQYAGLDDPDLPHQKNPHGPPSVVYSQELEDFLSGLIISGLTLEQIAQIKGTPGRHTMLRWIAAQSHPFSIAYMRAKQMMVPVLEERAKQIALTPLRMVTKTVKQVLNKDGKKVTLVEERESDNVMRSTLAFNAFQWELGHLVPKKHGRQASPDEGDGGLKDLLAQFRQRSAALEDE